VSADRAWLAAHLPQQGAMMLLEEVVDWDALRLGARASSHRAPANPLRRGPVLPVACGIEYAAQAVAAHGALLAAGPATPGFLASVRALRFHVLRLDDLPEALEIEVERIGGAAGGMLYGFRVASAGRALLDGRLAIALAAAP
jgi:predicted hotdog family 3-hydroxylacyl-ACP dehydratase